MLQDLITLTLAHGVNFMGYTSWQALINGCDGLYCVDTRLEQSAVC